VPTECTPVRLSFEGKLVRIYSKSTNKRLAVLVSPTLQKLVCEFAVTLTATLCGKKPKSIAAQETREAGAKKVIRVSFCSLRIVVYGLLHQKYAVGDALGDGELYLQHPSETEFDSEVKYFNPQYLLPPGEDMPPLDKLSISTCCANRRSRSAASRDSLGEHDRSQILRIFDTAYKSVDGVAAIELSPRLATKLNRSATSPES
jgi:SWI/SNF-related matrix-associated actin-dependent regulator of chromatin subfamily A3